METEHYIVIIHEETFGVTQPALQALRNELAWRINNKVEVLSVGSVGNDHCEGYGLFIVDLTTHQVAVVGDGFRADGGGEGGKGHRAACALLDIYGIKPEVAGESIAYFTPQDPAQRAAVIEKFHQVADRCVEWAKVLQVEEMISRRPQYPDWVYHSR